VRIRQDSDNVPRQEQIATSYHGVIRRVLSYTRNVLCRRVMGQCGERDTLYKMGIEYVVNKQDVEKYTKTIRKYCRVRGMWIDGREDTRTRVISPLQDPGRGDVKRGRTEEGQQREGETNYGRTRTDRRKGTSELRWQPRQPQQLGGWKETMWSTYSIYVGGIGRVLTTDGNEGCGLAKDQSAGAARCTVHYRRKGRRRS